MKNPENPNSYNFNNQDYDFVFRLYNGINDVYLSNTIWEDLYLEEDIFDWKIKGSVVIKSPYESLERESEQSLSLVDGDKRKIVYKFRNDCRDTLFISIKPKVTDVKNTDVQLDDSVWRLELEAVIYDVEELSNDNYIDKYKKLYFWEKTYQLMREKDCDFSTATAGENKNKGNVDQLDNSERSLQTGIALAELLKTDDTFKVHSNLTQYNETWDNGLEQDGKIYYSNPVGYKFIDALEYLYRYHVSTHSNDYQPCILKFERAEKSLQPKQFSLKPLKSYFEKAGNDVKNPKEYQVEHFFIYSHGENANDVPILKAPLSKSFKTEFKGDDFSTIRDYKIVDMSGLFYSENLCNYRVVSYNRSEGQMNEETKLSAAENYKKFYRDYIRKNVVTTDEDDRLPFTPFIRDSLNTKTINSLRTNPFTRLADGRNIMLKHYIFSNLAISFNVKGSTHRQTGRFFAVSKTSQNNNEFDNKLEGQYFLTNIIHHFSNSNRSYTNQILGVKTHSYKETTKFAPNDNLIIKNQSETNVYPK